jgi:hypothetical protein
MKALHCPVGRQTPGGKHRDGLQQPVCHLHDLELAGRGCVWIHGTRVRP